MTKRSEVGAVETRAVRRRQLEIQELQSRSKRLDELVATETFTVSDVVAESHATFFTDSSEHVMGMKVRPYTTGFTLRLVLQVLPEHSDVPVRTLFFSGLSIVKGGDYISAKIPRYELIEVEGIPGYRTDNFFYLPRNFNVKEDAIELTLLSANGPLRRDRSVDYKKFVKE